MRRDTTVVVEYNLEGILTKLLSQCHFTFGITSKLAIYREYHSESDKGKKSPLTYFPTILKAGLEISRSRSGNLGARAGLSCISDLQKCF